MGADAILHQGLERVRALNRTGMNGMLSELDERYLQVCSRCSSASRWQCYMANPVVRCRETLQTNQFMTESMATAVQPFFVGETDAEAQDGGTVEMRQVRCNKPATTPHVCPTSRRCSIQRPCMPSLWVPILNDINDITAVDPCRHAGGLPHQSRARVRCRLWSGNPPLARRRRWAASAVDSSHTRSRCRQAPLPARAVPGATQCRGRCSCCAPRAASAAAGLLASQPNRTDEAPVSTSYWVLQSESRDGGRTAEESRKHEAVR